MILHKFQTKLMKSKNHVFGPFLTIFARWGTLWTLMKTLMNTLIFVKAEMSLDEIIKSINSETNNKPPSNDGLTAEFYRILFKWTSSCPFRCLWLLGKAWHMGVTYRTGIISAIRAVSRMNYFRKMGWRPKWQAPKKGYAKLL